MTCCFNTDLSAPPNYNPSSCTSGNIAKVALTLFVLIGVAFAAVSVVAYFPATTQLMMLSLGSGTLLAFLTLLVGGVAACAQKPTLPSQNSSALPMTPSAPLANKS